MTIKLIKKQLKYLDQDINALVFLPDPSKDIKPALCCFTHGYTSHKASILNWPTRLVEEGVACILFDLPGHYLGGFSEVENFEDFKRETPGLFYQALEVLKEEFKQRFPLEADIVEDEDTNVFFSGHSLGAMMSLFALQDERSKDLNAQSICVGLGMPPVGVTHIFDTPFYKATLVIRGQLVSPALDPKEVFPWIKEAKETIKLTDKKVHFLTGDDDLVVGKDGTERFVELLKAQGNDVSLDKPRKLPHHQPELAASGVKKIILREIK